MLGTERELVESRRRRASVVELEDLLRLGRRVLAGEDAARVAGALRITLERIGRAVVLARGEARGLLNSGTPMTLEEAMIACGIEG